MRRLLSSISYVHTGSGTVVLESVNQAIGRAVVAGDSARFFKFRQDRLGKFLAKFDSPLVERIDIPDNALSKNLVFVEGDQDAERFWRQLVEKNRVGRAIAREDLMRDQLFQRLPLQPIFLEFLAYFVSGLALH